MVFSKSAGDGSLAMRSIAASSAAIAASSSGLKPETSAWSKGGTPPKGPLHAGLNAAMFPIGVLSSSDAGARIGPGHARKQVIDLGARGRGKRRARLAEGVG